MKFPKRIFSFFMAVIMLLPSLMFYCSAVNDCLEKQSDEKIKERLALYADDMNPEEKHIIQEPMDIKSFSGLKRYVVYSISPCGFAVYDKNSGIVEEMTLGKENPFSLDSEGDYYYGGPMNYLLSINNKYYTIDMGYELSQKDLDCLFEAEMNTVNNRKEIKAPPITTNNYYLSNSSYFTSLLGNNYGDNNTGICTQIACQIMLGYYDCYVNSRYVPNGYRSGYGTTNSFLAYLETFIGTTSSGLANACTGLNDYFFNIFFPGTSASCSIGNHNTVYTNVSNRVSNNRPTVIAMFSSYNVNCPLNHTVVAYGYRESLNGAIMTSASYYVHTGWKAPADSVASYSWDWFADSLMING